MPSSTLYAPVSEAEFNSKSLNFGATGVATSSITANDTTNIDLEMVDDMLMTGLELVISNPKAGDYMTLHVVHPTYGEINTFVSSWYMGENSFRQFYKVQYPAKIFAGLKIRAKYVSTTATAPTFVAINYALHKVLY